MTSKPGIIIFNVTKRRTNEVIWGHSNAIVRNETAKEYFRLDYQVSKLPRSFSLPSLIVIIDMDFHNGLYKVVLEI